MKSSYNPDEVLVVFRWTEWVQLLS